MRIPITKPYFDAEERENIVKPLDTGWVVQGPYVAEFQERFAAYTGASHAIATSNCTTALHLSLLALGIGKGDTVAVPSFTYVATANAVEAVGAKPVFCDVDLRTFCMDVAKLAMLLDGPEGKGIRAVLPVNQFGLCAPLDRIRALADEHGLRVIEDCACSFGSFLEGRHSGIFGHAGCFSFHPRKAITTGEGGMVITDDADVARSVSSLRDHGASRSDRERHGQKGGFFLPEFNVVGYNFRMTDFQGALGVSQMKKAEMLLEGRRAVAARYDEALREFPWLVPPLVPEGYVSGYQSYVCLFASPEDLSSLTRDRIDTLHEKRNAFMSFLEEHGVSTRQGTHAVHTLGYYRETYGLSDEDYLMSYAADRLSVAFPLYFGMTDEEFAYVIDAIREGGRL
jgi:dTDP-4-amino-4,6-dideoxygalactose transaminase